MTNALTLALKDLRVLTREPMGLFWIFVFPLLFALFFGAVFSGEGRRAAMSIAVVDEDDSDGSRAFVARLKESAALQVEPLPLPEARMAVRQGRLVGYVVVKKGFGAASPFSGQEAPAIAVGMDPARKAEAGYLQGLLMEAASARMQELFSDPRKSRQQVDKALRDLDQSKEMNPEQRASLKQFLGSLDQFMDRMDAQPLAERGAMQLVRIEPEEVTPERVGPRSPWQVTFPSAILWGVLGCVTGFSLSIVSERTGGTWLRLRTSPMSRREILLGKASACFIMCVTVAVILLLIGRVVLNMRIDNPVALAPGVLCTAFCFVGIMMFLSTLGKTEQGVAGIGWGIMMPLAMIGGGMVPLFLMPEWMQTASNFSPVKWGIISLEGPIWRGFGLAEMLKPCGILVAIGAVFLSAGVWSLSRQDA